MGACFGKRTTPSKCCTDAPMDSYRQAYASNDAPSIPGCQGLRLPHLNEKSLEPIDSSEEKIKAASILRPGYGYISHGCLNHV